jgi:hypothetical protein
MGIFTTTLPNMYGNLGMLRFEKRIDVCPAGITRMTSKRIEKGSRLVLVVNGNKHPFDQVNYGTGQDASTECQNLKLYLVQGIR